MQNRIKSPVVWGAILTQVLLIMTATGVIDVQVIDTIKVIGVAVIEILTLLAILNNPTNPNGF